MAVAQREYRAQKLEKHANAHRQECLCHIAALHACLWYAGFSIETAGIEVAFHKSEELREINWREKEAFLYVDFLADFRGEFHDILRDSRFADCLDPNSYSASQRLARELLAAGSAGIVYPSVRHPGGTCIACFRPALVNNVRKAGRISVEFENALATPIIRSIPEN